MTAALMQRARPEISQLSEHVGLLNRSLINCMIMLNNLNNDQGIANYKDAEKLLKEVNEMASDIGRKVRGENQ